MNSMLKVHNHNLFRGNSSLAADICFDMNLGDRLIVSGRNGSGKSSFLEDLFQSFRKKSPTVQWSNSDLSLFRITQNLTFDSNSPDSVTDYLYKTILAYPIKNRALSPAHLIQKSLEQVQLKDKWLCELSGGEKQKLKFAQCLILKPQVILLDEPFSAVDPSTKFQLYQILDLLKKSTLQVIVVHDLLDIKRLNAPVMVFENQKALFFEPLTWFRKVDSLLHAETCHNEIQL